MRYVAMLIIFSRRIVIRAASLNDAPPGPER